MPVGRYTTIADVRAEGAPFSDSTTYPDAWVQGKIDLASELIENFCGHWFVSKERTLHLDGNGRKTLVVPAPIVQIDAITIITPTRFGTSTTYSIALDEVQVYNRHLTHGLASPNDRKNPGIAIDNFLGEPYDSTDVWPLGEQNVTLEGKFGWTDLAYGTEPAETEAGSQIPADEGVTPITINRACLMLVRMHFPQLGDYQGSLGTGAITGIRRMQARDQSIQFDTGSGRGAGSDALKYVGGTTGNEVVDRMLLGFRRIPAMEWA